MPGNLVDLITISVNRDALDRLKSGGDIAEAEKLRPQVCEACPFYVQSTEWDVYHCILFGKDVEPTAAKAAVAEFCKLDWVVIRYKGG